MGFPASPLRAQPLPDRRPMAGTILDENNHPLKNAIVSIRRQDSNGAFAFWGGDTLTDDAGHFDFPLAELGNYYLNVELAGFGMIMNQPVAWTETSPPIAARMQHLATVNLKVLKVDGTPVASGRLFVRLRLSDGGPTYATSAISAAGEASLPGLPVGQYSLYATVPHQGFACLLDLPLEYAPLPKPVTLHLEPGATLHLDVTSVPGPGVPARGLGGGQLTLVPANPSEAARLLGAGADPSENVGLVSAQGNESALITAEGTGEIVLTDLPPGKYLAHLVVAAQPDIPGREVQLVASTVSTVHWEAPEVTGAALELDLDQVNGTAASQLECSVRMMPLHPMPGPGAPGTGAVMWLPFNSPRHGTSDASGALTLYPVVPNLYRLWVAPIAHGVQGTATSVDVQVLATGAEAKVKLAEPLR